MLRVISETKPQWIIGENVRGFISNNNGMVFENCCLDLEREGYAVQAFIIPACAVNAPHRRDRVWIVANRRCEHGERAKINGKSDRQVSSEENAPLPERSTCNDGEGIINDSASERYGKDNKIPTGRDGIIGADSHAPDSNSERLQRHIQQQSKQAGTYCGCVEDSTITDTEHSTPTRHGQDSGGILSITESIRPDNSNQWEEDWYTVALRTCVRTLDDGLPAGLARPKGWRVNSLKSLGNAVVPQIPYLIMKAILEAERSLI